MKHVFIMIMVASVLVIHNLVSLQAATGSGIGISGVLLYVVQFDKAVLSGAGEDGVGGCKAKEGQR